MKNWTRTKWRHEKSDAWSPKWIETEGGWLSECLNRWLTKTENLTSEIRLRIALRKLKRKGVPLRYILDILRGTPFLLDDRRRLWIIADGSSSIEI
jgi:hypothetical protein